MPGGNLNTAAGTNSFAAGRQARANHDGAFVWADSTFVDFLSTAPNQFLIRAAGGVGIGANNPGGFQLAVNGDAAKPGGGTWSVFSDARLKKDVEPLDDALERVLRLRGVSFEYKHPEEKLGLPGRQTGMIAQEVEQVFPDWVGEDEQGYKYVTFRGFEALTVEALRQLRQEKDAQIAALEAQVAEQQARLAALEDSVRKLGPLARASTFGVATPALGVAAPSVWWPSVGPGKEMGDQTRDTSNQ